MPENFFPNKEKPKEPLRLLPEDFVLPNLSPVTKETDPDNEYMRKVNVDFDFSHADKDFKGQIMFERISDNDRQETTYPVMLNVQAIEKGKQNFTFKFKGPLIFGKIDENSKPGDHIWHIFFRRVAQESQGLGFGKMALTLYEDVVAKIQKEYPELRADAIRIDTGLSSMAGLAIKKGYIAEYSSEEEVKRLLEDNTSDLHDRHSGRDKITFIKKIK